MGSKCLTEYGAQCGRLLWGNGGMGLDLTLTCARVLPSLPVFGCRCLFRCSELMVGQCFCFLLRAGGWRVAA